MVYNTQEYRVFGLFLSSDILKKTTFRKRDLFPSSGEGWKTSTMLGPLERANIKHWTQIPKRCDLQSTGRWTKFKNPVIHSTFISIVLTFVDISR
jgi:hypothetical protein